MNIILIKTEIFQYFLCHINKDSTVFSCSQTEIAKNAFKNDKTLFENCRELKAVVCGKEDYSNDI